MRKSLTVLLSFALLVFFVSCASKNMETAKADETKDAEKTVQAEKAAATEKATDKTDEAKPATAVKPLGNLMIEDAVIAANVKNLTPEGASSEFTKDTDKIFCFSKVMGAKEDTTIKHIWYHNDKKTAEIDLPVKSSSWRTYSYKTFVPEFAGTWKVDIADNEGNVLKSLNFTVK